MKDEKKKTMRKGEKKKCIMSEKKRGNEEYVKRNIYYERN